MIAEIYQILSNNSFKITIVKANFNIRVEEKFDFATYFIT